MAIDDNDFFVRGGDRFLELFLAFNSEKNLALSLGWHFNLNYNPPIHSKRINEIGHVTLEVTLRFDYSPQSQQNIQLLL